MDPAEHLRHWLITSTTYGTWLPGDTRGFVSNVRVDGESRELRHNQVGQDYDRKLPSLETHARQKLQSEPILLSRAHADVLLNQFQETCRYRYWQLIAAAIMSNHFHAVLAVTGDPEPKSLLRDLKSYGSRALNKHFGKPTAPRWWTESGSTRKLPTTESLIGAVRYVVRQPDPLAIWSANIPLLENLFGERGASAP